MNSVPLLSVCCATYNQEAYIAAALDGFLMQKTDFPIEILVYDDHSNDQTAEIIKKYAADHAHIVPMLQSENYFSKGKKPLIDFVFPKARGKYVAVCEGDDYWTDPLKLQKQIDAMTRVPGCALCFHPAVETYADHSLADKVICNHADEACFFGIHEMILGGGGFMPSASMVLKKEAVLGLPDWFHQVSAGDTFLQIYAAKAGSVLFLPDVMAVYRRFVPGSWSERIEKDRQPKALHQGYVDCLRLMKQDFPEQRQLIDYRIAYYCKLLKINETKEMSIR